MATSSRRSKKKNRGAGGSAKYRQVPTKDVKGRVDSAFPRPESLILRPESLFLLTALVFGLLFILLTPPFQLPDEIVHFHRAFAVSEGNFVMEIRDLNPGADMPVGIQELPTFFDYLRRQAGMRQDPEALLRLFQRPLQPEIRSFVPIPSAGNYAPVPYLPHVLGIWTGRLLHVPAIGLFYLARLFGLVSYLIGVFFAIRMLPWGKWFLAVLALMPMALTEAMGISADSVTMSLCFLLFALVVRRVGLMRHGQVDGGKVDVGKADMVGGRGFWNGVHRKTGIPAREWVVFLLLSATIPLCKNVYILLLGMLLLLPLVRMTKGSRETRQVPALLTGVLLCWGTALVVFFFWNSLVANITAYSPVVGADPAAQVRFLLDHPGPALKTMITSLVRQLPLQLRSMVGVLGWLETVLPTIVYAGFGLMFSMLLILDGPGVGLRGRNASGVVDFGLPERVWSAILGTGILLAIHVALYVIWTPVGAPEVSGVQGRYYIVVVPLFLAGFGIRSAKDLAWIKRLLFTLVPVMLAVTAHTLYLRYWGPK